MHPLAQNGYTEQEVLDALRGKFGARRWSFRYDLLDRNNAYLNRLDNVLACSVSMSYLSDIKRTARFVIRDEGSINYLSDRIQPWVRLAMPPLKPSQPKAYADVVSAFGSPLLWYKFDDPASATFASNSGSSTNANWPTDSTTGWVGARCTIADQGDYLRGTISDVSVTTNLAQRINNSSRQPAVAGRTYVITGRGRTNTGCEMRSRIEFYDAASGGTQLSATSGNLTSGANATSFVDIPELTATAPSGTTHMLVWYGTYDGPKSIGQWFDVSDGVTSDGVSPEMTINGTGTVPSALGLVEGSSFRLTTANDNYMSSNKAGAQLSHLEQLTVSLWFRATASDATDYLVDTTDGSNNGGLSIAKTSDNRIQVCLNLTTGKLDAITPSPGQFGADTVFNLILTWKTGKGMRLYANGEEVELTHSGIPNDSVGITDNNAGMKIGGWWNDSTANSANLLDGWIDDVSIIPKYLTNPLDARNIYLAGARLGRYGDEEWVEWPQGVFLLTSPSRKSDEAKVVTREVEAYDPLKVLTDDKTDDRYTIPAGAIYTDAVSSILGSMDKNITPDSRTLPTDKEWEPGTAFLTVINELLGAINYGALYFDEHGTAIASPYVAPTDRAPEFVYRDDADSVTLPDVDQTIDLFDVPNKWVLVVSDADRPALRSELINDDPGSLTSTVSRGRTILDFRTEQDAADQATLDAKVARLAVEASQVFEEIEFETSLMPIHSHNDVYTFAFSNLVVDDKYAETGWELSMEAGATMKHTIRRVVSLNV